MHNANEKGTEVIFLGFYTRTFFVRFVHRKGSEAKSGVSGKETSGTDFEETPEGIEFTVCVCVFRREDSITRYYSKETLLGLPHGSRDVSPAHDCRGNSWVHDRWGGGMLQGLEPLSA